MKEKEERLPQLFHSFAVTEEKYETASQKPRSDGGDKKKKGEPSSSPFSVWV